MNEELNLCLASLLKMHFDNFQEREIYFTKNNFFGNIFRFQEMHYYFTSNFAFSFSFFFFFLHTTNGDSKILFLGINKKIYLG